MKFERYRSPQERMNDLYEKTTMSLAEIRQSVFEGSIDEMSATYKIQEAMLEHLKDRVKICAESGDSRNVEKGLEVIKIRVGSMPDLRGFYLQTLQEVSSLLRQYEKNLLD